MFIATPDWSRGDALGISLGLSLAGIFVLSALLKAKHTPQALKVLNESVNIADSYQQPQGDIQ